MHFKCKGELFRYSRSQNIQILRDLFSNDIKMELVQIDILVSDRDGCLYCLDLSFRSADLALWLAEYMSDMRLGNYNDRACK